MTEPSRRTVVSSGRRLALVAMGSMRPRRRPHPAGSLANDGGPISWRGTYEGGRYLIEVPAGWNGGLVLFAHGYDGGTFDSPLTSHLLDRGYALAASSFRTEAYRVDLFVVRASAPRYRKHGSAPSP
jgi:hypothetical protein